jgi:MFS family permease
VGVAVGLTEPSGRSWRNRDYKLFLAGQAASAIGNGVTFTVLPLAVVEMTRSGSRLGLLGLLQTLPALTMGLLAGSMADRYDRRRLMIAADAGRAVLIAMIPLAWYAGVPLLPVIYAAVVPVAVLTPVFLAAYNAAVPSLAGRAHVPAATAELQAVAAVGFVAGPGLTAALIAVVRPVAVLWLDVASFVISAACLALIRRRLHADGELRPAGAGLLTGIREGLAFIRRTPAVSGLLCFWVGVSGSTVLLIPAVAYLADVERSLPGWSFPAIVAGFSFGALGGFAAAARLSRAAAGPPMLAATALTGLAVVTIVHLRGIAPLVGGAVIGGAGSGCSTCLYVAARTNLTPDHLLGRIGSVSELATDAVSPVALLAEGLILDALGGTVVMTAIGCIFVAAGIAFMLSPSLRGVRAAADDGRSPGRPAGELT